ncbi:hypothetical protein CORC01_01318 [Colletotrichum orchidophilum]|uniref:Chitinase n=1 Tax=Colletotrichum orchidophilum TaxID=1209926 RepID=A0A1G4BPM9_9PEZI|nr:uncharacterized protein CORC01_01318 [Colletotrichum orchidophilum]OHF03265.1 hypothetical protein CORC01_01318 [Colletotrichum orchidophilum]
MCGIDSADDKTAYGLKLCCSFFGWYGTETVQCRDPEPQYGKTPCHQGFGSCEMKSTTQCATSSGTSNGRQIGYYQRYNIRERACDKGADINWEYPSEPKRGGRAPDVANLVLLMKEMRAAFSPKGFRSSLALAPDYWYLRGFHPADMQEYMGFMGFMSRLSALSGNSWVGYDDDETYALKHAFANDLCIGRAKIWSIDFGAETGGGGALNEYISPESATIIPMAHTTIAKGATFTLGPGATTDIPRLPKGGYQNTPKSAGHPQAG